MIRSMLFLTGFLLSGVTLALLAEQDPAWWALARRTGKTLPASSANCLEVYGAIPDKSAISGSPELTAGLWYLKEKPKEYRAICFYQIPEGIPRKVSLAARDGNTHLTSGLYVLKKSDLAQWNQEHGLDFSYRDGYWKSIRANFNCQGDCHEGVTVPGGSYIALTGVCHNLSYACEQMIRIE